MSVIKLSTFGGLMPSKLARALPDTAAQKSHNLLASTPEFRPLQNDLAVATSAVSNPKTLHRLARKADGTFNADMTSGWITNAAELNYVKGQTNDDKTERTYYTFADGTQPARVMDATGQYRQLGVPAPTSAPTGHINSVYSYTPEARSAELADARDKAVNILRKYFQLTWLGAPKPGNTTPGYMELYDPNIYNPDHSKVFKVFAVDGPNSRNVVTSYTNATLTAQAQYHAATATTPEVLGVFDPRLGGQYAQAIGPYSGTSWAAPGQNVYVVPFFAYGRTYDLDATAQANVVAEFRAIKIPGTGGAQQLFTDAQTQAFINNLRATCGPTSPRIKPLLDALSGGCLSMRDVMDTGNLSSIEYVVQKQVEFKVLSDAIGAEYDKIDGELSGMLEQFYYSSGIDMLVPQGTPRILQDRFYIYTYVTDWKEESAPSPVSELVELDENDTVTGFFAAPPVGRYITKVRVYRTNTGNSGAAFQFVDEIDIATSGLTYTDAKKSTELGEVCPTITWAEPPKVVNKSNSMDVKYLQGLTAMTNGIHAGFIDNSVYFCENYVAYAFPVEYMKTTEYPIVGLGCFGQTLVVLTTGKPHYMSGTSSASISAVKLDSAQACVSRRSIASGDTGVIYASADGLCRADSTGVNVITRDHFALEDWRKLNPSSIVGALHEGTYIFMYNNGTAGCYALHLDTGKLTTIDVTGSTFYVDLATDRLYTCNGTSIVALFSDVTHRTAVWRSKVAVMNKYESMAWLEVQSTFESPVTVRHYGDGSLSSETVVSTRTPERLPIGEYLEHEVEIVSSARANCVTLAGSTDELKQV